MNVIANARSSAAALQATSIPVLRASAFCGGELQTRALLLYATYPSYAPDIVKSLEAQSRFNRLDEALTKALKTAKATVARSAGYKSRFH